MSPEERYRLVERLYEATMRSLLQRLKDGRAGNEILQVARLFLQDRNALAGAMDKAETRALKRLRALYLRKLLETLDRPDPPASLLREARFLHEATHTGELAKALKGTSKGVKDEPQAMPFIAEPPKGVQ